MEFTFVSGLGHPAEIAELFDEYTAMLIAGDACFAAYLEQQRYDDELRHLEEKYGEPRGRLILALCGGEAAGCIALHPLDETRCELKRLYVRPAFRGCGLGRMLSERIIADAKAIGYREMLLDTLPFLTEAIALYRSLGFREIPQYNDSPMTDAIYLRLEL